MMTRLERKCGVYVILEERSDDRICLRDSIASLKNDTLCFNTFFPTLSCDPPKGGDSTDRQGRKLAPVGLFCTGIYPTHVGHPLESYVPPGEGVAHEAGGVRHPMLAPRA